MKLLALFMVFFITSPAVQSFDGCPLCNVDVPNNWNSLSFFLTSACGFLGSDLSSKCKTLVREFNISNVYDREYPKLVDFKLSVCRKYCGN